MGYLVSRSIRTSLVFASATALVVACGSEGTSGFNPGSFNEDAGGPVGTFAPPTDDGDGGLIRSNCVPRTCADQGIQCGPAGDGCGGIIPDCGQCGAGMRCGGPNAPSMCVSANAATSCTPKTCAELSVQCGQAGDGCGGILSCGTCPAGQQCGSTDAPSQCVSAVATSPDGGVCVPKTALDYNAENKDCGVQSNGCGGTINLGDCTAPEFCGGGGPSKCAESGGGACTPKTCADYPGKCGPQPNGCGGVTTNCGTCTLPQVCGGGGVPSVCGGGGVTNPGGGTCVPIITCGPSQCGVIANGCGGTLDCGTSKCTSGQICGGAGTPNVCGAPFCTPITACPAGMNCGVIANGCGGTVACGPPNACKAPAICGGAGQPNVCGGGGVSGDGGGGACTPITTCQPNQCGPIANGCGGIVNCPDCTGGAVCGGGGTPSVCAGGTCTPRTAADCATLGVNCGFIADGCGGPPVQCGATCPNGGICGLNSPNVCSTSTVCTGFCQNQAACTPTTKTRVTGTVFAPNGTLPIPDALIYVPNGAATSPFGVTPITSGVTGAGTCEQCNSQASGNPLVSTKSAFNGTFTLDNVPAGVQFPIVIQLGKWRRMVMVGPFTACQSHALTAAQTRLPTRQNEGNNNVDNIPLVAISTGRVDALECVLRKLGIADNQFGNPVGYTGAGGRIRLYQDNESGSGRRRGNGGARINTSTPRTDAALTDTQAHLDQYDAVVFACPGRENDRSDAIDDRVRTYANKGGRVFATHFNYVYLYDRTPWDGTLDWDTTASQNLDNATGRINTSFTKGNTFAQWLGTPAVNALSATNPFPTISIVDARSNGNLPAASGAEVWITNDSQDQGAGTDVFHYTFNTPWNVAPANQCGRVIFSDFHVSIGTVDITTDFPDECNSDPLTSQEKVLAFMLFDLTSCISTPQPPTCTARTCADYPAGTCGQQSDGCGGLTVDCGKCTPPQTCGGAGVASRCGVGSTCTPRTCAAANANCGQIPDGCGALLNCGSTCPNGQTCGGGGVANRCGAPSCTPKTCAQQNVMCGQTGNGCGGLLNCGTCPSGQTCGGGGVANQCGAPACTPLTQCPAGKNCGSMPNGCGGVISCGTCPNGQSCGGGGSPNTCGAASCSPKTCADLGAQCGVVSDQCGGTDTCSPCAAGQFCNAQNLCVPPSCTPQTCAQLGVECGPTGNTCGGLLQCGTCPAGTGCGAGGVPGKCGTNPCTPKSCSDLEAECGQVANGCGGLTPDCGTCAGALSCKNGVCVLACTPRTCADVGANCGFIADGCGSTVDCGTCKDGETCGFEGLANVCGSNKPK